ncbi:MAG: antitoxin VbhA family protein [bacterium]
MTKIQILRRQKAVAAAVGSVRAEGLKTTIKTQKQLKEYAEGKITIAKLRRVTIDDIKAKQKKK